MTRRGNMSLAPAPLPAVDGEPEEGAPEGAPPDAAAAAPLDDTNPTDSQPHAGEDTRPAFIPPPEAAVPPQGLGEAAALELPAPVANEDPPDGGSPALPPTLGFGGLDERSMESPPDQWLRSGPLPLGERAERWFYHRLEGIFYLTAALLLFSCIGSAAFWRQQQQQASELRAQVSDLQRQADELAKLRAAQARELTIADAYRLSTTTSGTTGRFLAAEQGPILGFARPLPLEQQVDGQRTELLVIQRFVPLATVSLPFDTEAQRTESAPKLLEQLQQALPQVLTPVPTPAEHPPL